MIHIPTAAAASALGQPHPSNGSDRSEVLVWPMLLVVQKRAVAPSRATRCTRMVVVAKAAKAPTKTATGLTVLAR